MIVVNRPTSRLDTTGFCVDDFTSRSCKEKTQIQIQCFSQHRWHTPDTRRCLSRQKHATLTHGHCMHQSREQAVQSQKPAPTTYSRVALDIAQSGCRFNKFVVPPKRNVGHTTPPPAGLRWEIRVVLNQICCLSKLATSLK